MGAERPLQPGRDCNEVRTCREDAWRAIAKLGPLADRTVSAGALLHIGESYDWPGWLVEGTSFTPGEPIPATITIADELVAAANFYDHVDPLHFAIKVVRLPLAGMGPMTVLAFKTAPTLRAALEHSSSLHGSRVPHSAARLEVTDAGSELHFDSEYLQGRLLGAYAVSTLALYYSLCGAFVAQVSRESRLELTLDGPNQQEFADEIGCPVVFGAATNRLIITGDLLDLPNPGFDNALWELVLQKARQDSAHVTQALTALLVGRIRSHLDQYRVPRLKQVADEVQMSERTIVRTLHGEGTSFRLLVDSERRNRAVELLSDRSVELSDVSRQLGFSDRPSFWRTFRRWFGVTPAQFRRD